jgi:hypothetical protein
MKSVFAMIILVLISIGLDAQPDTNPEKPNTIVEVYDVVVVYREHVDGRGRVRQYTSELKGEILNYDESTGVLTFKGIDGKIYSLKSGEYKYFQYDKEFRSKSKQHVLHPRKDSGYEFSAGFSAGFILISDNFTADDYYLSGWGSGINFPGSVKLGLSKYLNKNSLGGLTAEYAMLTFDKTYFNIGARYQYLYDLSKNTSLYFPAELNFSRYQFETQYVTNDTTFIDPFSWTYPTYVETEISINALELNVGQGLSIALKNKRSVSLELMMIKQFTLTTRFRNSSSLTPKSDLGITGVKLAVLMNF